MKYNIIIETILVIINNFSDNFYLVKYLLSILNTRFINIIIGIL